MGGQIRFELEEKVPWQACRGLCYGETSDSRSLAKCFLCLGSDYFASARNDVNGF